MPKLISKSISQEIFSNICKYAQNIPIFKNDSRSLCNNYKPITLLSNLSKIFEKVIYSNFSINNVLLKIVEKIQKQLDCWSFYRPKKAFDTVDHNVLLEKLDCYGIRGVAKNWFCSYLNNQKQYVMLNGSTSSIKPVSTGVTQGPAVDPLLILIYINDLNMCVLQCLLLFQWYQHATIKQFT